MIQSDDELATAFDAEFAELKPNRFGIKLNDDIFDISMMM